MSDEKMLKIVKRIKDRRQALGLSYQDLADRTGMSKSTLQRYETGAIKNIPLDKLEVLTSALGIDPVELLDLLKQVPLYEVAAGPGRINSDYATETTSLLNLKEGEFVATVRGSSMAPTLQDGDLVIIRQQGVLDHDGQIALVKINGDESTIKRVKKIKQGLYIYADNPSVFSPIVFTEQEIGELPISVEGVVVRYVREL